MSEINVASSREAVSLTMCKFYKIDPFHRYLFYVSNDLRTPTLKNTSRWLASECCSAIALCLIINLQLTKKAITIVFVDVFTKSHFSCFFSKDNNICGFL